MRSVKRQDPLKIEKNVDLQRYQGRWYEIACIPSRFQPRSGRNTTATYALRPDGTIHLLNETWVDGKRASIEGTAWKADPASEEAKLNVRFWVPPFLPVIPVTGNYWVMQLDPDYRWALVGLPCRKYLWVLSRTPELGEDIYFKLLQHAEEEGYDVSQIVRTRQDEESGSLSQKGESEKGAWWLKSLVGK